ncbi:mycofactocin radical SAM maturase [Desulfobacula sp.]|uniref:mycofactocin radical SAM maturase n=1 Tax=Desulfobacula sp. TaxID=2593537 RepID=UPI002620E9B5|nr:mycofactocin radical SAM maturase [Desulfobacula sp.]
MSSKLARTGLRAPVNVTWEMTLKCNLKCAHCLSDSGVAAADELTTPECRRLIDQLTHMKVFQVNIGGGEPFFREDFFELLQYAHDRQLVTCVSTNGTLVDDRLAKKLSRLKMLYLQVSLDGATAQVNDGIRGKGTYEKILQAMACLARHHVPFSINTVLTRINYSQLDALRKIAASFGSEMRVSRFRPSGRAKNSVDTLGPEKWQLENFALWLENHDLVRTGDSFFCLTSEKRRRKGLDMCGAAKMTCCISPNGDVYPCAFLQESPFHAGNVRKDDFQDMWDNSMVFSNLRNLNVETCMTCSRFDVCRGGCPAMAYHTYHDINMPDPECLVNLKKIAS